MSRYQKNIPSLHPAFVAIIRHLELTVSNFLSLIRTYSAEPVRIARAQLRCRQRRHGNVRKHVGDSELISGVARISFERATNLTGVAQIIHSEP